MYVGITRFPGIAIITPRREMRTAVRALVESTGEDSER